jgi:hypothetical protein
MPRLPARVPLGVAIALYQTWLRLPPKQRAQLMGIAAEHGRRVAMKHGPRVAASLVRRRYGSKP